MPNISVISTAGLESLHVSYRNALGSMNGFANLTAANVNVSSGMRRLAFVQSVPNPDPNRVLVRSKGDDGYGRGFNFAGEPPSVEVRLGRADIVAMMAMMGATYYDLGNWRFGIDGVSLPTLADFMALTIAQAGAEDSGAVGSGFITRIYPNIQLVPLGQAEQSFQAEGTFRYTMIVNPFTVLPWSAALAAANFTVGDGLSMFAYNQYRLMLHAWVGNAAATGPTLDYTPVSVAETKAFSGDTGTALTVSTVTPATKVVVLSAAPASGALTDTLYSFTRYS